MAQTTEAGGKDMREVVFDALPPLADKPSRFEFYGFKVVTAEPDCGKVSISFRVLEKDRQAVLKASGAKGILFRSPLRQGQTDGFPVVWVDCDTLAKARAAAARTKGCCGLAACSKGLGFTFSQPRWQKHVLL